VAQRAVVALLACCHLSRSIQILPQATRCSFPALPLRLVAEQGQAPPGEPWGLPGRSPLSVACLLPGLASLQSLLARLGPRVDFRALVRPRQSQQRACLQLGGLAEEVRDRTGPDLAQ